jgi:predicted Zn-dependent peptidase
MKRIFLGLSLASLLGTLTPFPNASAQDAPRSVPSAASSTSAQLRAEKVKLKNGLEVILHEDHRTPIVSVNVYYHVGSKDEPPGRNGFAHLFEHVMFQGSKHVPEDQFFPILERAGATDVNGTTNDDRTNYFETVPKNRLELALWLESDRMAFLLDHADKATFDSQRDVVKNERRQNYENAPYGLVYKFVREAVFPVEHPYHLLTIGTPEDLDAARIDDVRGFFRTWYVPNNASLAIAGDFDKKVALDLVEKYFGPIASGPVPARKLPPAVSLSGETQLQVSAAVEMARVMRAWPTPAFFAPGDAELDLVAHVLTSGKTSRLYKRLVYELQLCQDVNAGQGSMEWGSMFTISATVRPGQSAQTVARVIDEELERLSREGPTAAELARAKTVIAANAIFDLERTGGRANHLNLYNHYTGDPNYLENDMRRYSSATESAVRDAAARYLPLTRRVTVDVKVDKSAPLAGRLDAKNTPAADLGKPAKKGTP